MFAVAGGGALGALARHYLTAWVAGMASAEFPWGTLIVNVVGSFCLGFLLIAMTIRPVSDEVRGFATVGLLGAFTTFSTFSQEAVTLFQAGYQGRAAAYVLSSVLVGLLSVAVGAALASNTLSTAP